MIKLYIHIPFLFSKPSLQANNKAEAAFFSFSKSKKGTTSKTSSLFKFDFIVT